MANTIDINSDELVQFSNTLEKMHRSALPLAVRQSLNDAAKDMKIKGKGYEGTIQDEFEANFTIRKKSFIRSHTAFKSSKNTFNIDEMESEAGVIKGKSEAGDRLALQEKGGAIDRDRIPTSTVRVGKSDKKLVSKRFFYKNIKGSKRRTRQKTLIETDNAMLQVLKGGAFELLYIKNKRVNIPKKPFIKPAGIDSAKKLEAFFIKRAQERINKLK